MTTSIPEGSRYSLYQCIVRIKEAGDGIPVDTSNAVFSIYSSIAITVTAPNGGENWMWVPHRV